MKRIQSFFVIVVMSILNTGMMSGAVRTDARANMPRGLAVEKTPTAPPKKREHRVRNLKHKRKGLQFIKKKYTFSDLHFYELKEAKNKQVDNKNYFVACKYLERMIRLCDDINEKAGVMIELADLFVEQQKFDDAAKWYTEFVQLYPGNKQVEYASYRSVICASKNILGADRDQSPTEKTLELAHQFLKREDLFATYKKEVRQIERECYQRLAASDIRVAEFYIIKQHDYDSAKKRLSTIRDEWLEKAPEVELELARLEVTLSGLCVDFNVSEESIECLLSQAVIPTEKKANMANRF